MRLIPQHGAHHTAHLLDIAASLNGNEVENPRKLVAHNGSLILLKPL